MYSSRLMILVSICMLVCVNGSFAGDPQVQVTKQVDPDTIFLANSGEAPETMEVTLAVTGFGGTVTDTIPIDIAFGIDSSGSMQVHDSSNQRIDAAKSIVDKLNSSRDTAGVVSWDDGIDFTYGLTSNFATLKSQIDSVDSSGGTNLNAGLNACIGMLDSNPRSGMSAEVIVFLSNGQGTYTFSGSPGSPADLAASKGYVVYTIGLGPYTWVDALTDIATTTGGSFYPAPTADSLQDIFDDILTEIIVHTSPSNVTLKDVTKDYIIDEGSFSIAPDSKVEVDGQTEMVWNNVAAYVGNNDEYLAADETFTVTFNARVSTLGQSLPVDDVTLSQVGYTTPDQQAAQVSIPQAYITVQLKHALTISSTSDGSVTNPGEGTFDYLVTDNTTQVGVVATPDPHYHFVEWTGTAVDAGKVADPCLASTLVTVDADYSLVAHFAIDRHNVHLSSSVGGHVVDLGEGDFWVDYGTEIGLLAKVDDPLFKFSHWLGTMTGRPDYHYDLTVTNDHDIRAIFQSTLDVLYVDDNAPNDAGPYSLSVSDPAENGTKDHPFDSIQEAIEVAKPGSTLVVLPGTYSESLLLRSKAIAVTSTDPDSNEPVLEYPVIQAPGDEPVVSFQFCTDPTMVLEGLVLTGANDNRASGIKSLRSDVVIKNCLIAGNRRRTSGSAGGGALSCSWSQVTLINCTLTENYGGINGAGVYANSTSTVTIMDSILWGNQPTEILTDASSVVTVATSDVAGGYAGTGNLDVDPVFVASGYWEHALNPGMMVLPSHFYAVWVSGDYHLTEGSPCVDAGDALSGYGLEPEPNGGQVNLGAYGNTPQAAMTPTP